MKFLDIFNIGTQVLTQVLAAASTIATGQPYTAPPIRTYIGGKHVELDLKVTML